MIADQCRMARAALRWSLDDLAEKARVGRATIARFETGTAARAESVAAMRTALEAAGVVFLDQDEPSKSGGPGIRLG